MDVHPTPFPGNKPQSVKSKYKKISEAPKQKIKEAPIQRNRRTFGTIRNPNVPAKTLPEKPKPKTSNQISVKQPKTEPETAPVSKTESAKKTPQNGSNEKAKLRKKKSVSFPEKLEESITKRSPAGEVDGVKTPVRPPFSVKPIRISGTPYLSAETCSSCRFDRLETASYWLGQIKSAESVGKHFVSAAFFRLANDCKAEPARTLLVELKKYLTRYDQLCTKTEWKEVSRMYGILKKETETKSNEDHGNLFYEDTGTQGGATDDQEQRVEDADDNDTVKEIFIQET
ncbi:uncharacterized protein LOC112500530 [Cynara cardunculus var. scolymus]|uniref:uncharacterized protein LOC112500530 n=1 Tax=Cynara cardunculus var. scolymus TaxID=59895 RepID=UPI000D628A12|nr:uncharacterized protein LOC112500530 [Cynara cardunculus var. scolymus]